MKFKIMSLFSIGKKIEIGKLLKKERKFEIYIEKSSLITKHKMRRFSSKS